MIVINFILRTKELMRSLCGLCLGFSQLMEHSFISLQGLGEELVFSQFRLSSTIPACKLLTKKVTLALTFNLLGATPTLETSPGSTK